MKWQAYTTGMSESWDDFVAASDDAWFCHRRGMLDAVNAAWREPEASVMVLDGSVVLGVLPLQYRAWDGGLWSSGRGAAGPALANNLDASSRVEVLRLLLQGAMEQAKALHATKLRCSWPVCAPARLAGAAAPVLPGSVTVCAQRVRVVRLNMPVQALSAAFRPSSRAKSRKAERAGVVVRALGREEAEQLYYPLHQATYRRTGETPHPPAVFSQLWKSGIEGDLNRVYAAVYEGKVRAVLNVARFKQAAWFQSGASDEPALALGMNHLLQATAILDACRDGLLAYEVGELFPGAEGKHQGLTQFKSGFGGEDLITEISEISTLGVLRKLRRGAGRIARRAGLIQ